MIKSAKDRGNKTLYLVIYLAPGDYHRYHSPAAFTASYRRHIAGYLEPVDPRYLKTHRDVFKSNERVNVLGDWNHGFFAMSFVGATNVGSIKLHFDDILKSNVKNPVSPYLQDRNYATLSSISSEGGNIFWTYPRRSAATSILETESHSIEPFLAEFDVKDIINPKVDDNFVFTPQLESQLVFNTVNGFKQAHLEVEAHKELLSKLEQPGGQMQQRTYTVTNNGVYLRKGEEMGMFEMGSTVVLLFECPDSTQIRV